LHNFASGNHTKSAEILNLRQSKQQVSSLFKIKDYPMALVEVKNIVKAFNEHIAVNDISFSVEAGKVFGLLGPNGAGKSTLINMVSTLLEPTRGDILIDGSSVVKKPMAVKKLIGVVPQEIALYPTLTARENLKFWGKMYGLSRADISKRTDSVLEIVGLADRANERIETYSGGMKRRINIAAGLLHSPTVLFMDEPTVGIDPQSRNHILETVKHLNSEGLTVIYTSHYMEEVEFLCDRIAIIDHGEVIASGTQDELRLMVGNKDVIKIAANGLMEEIIPVIKSIPGVSDATLNKEGIDILSSQGRKVLADVITSLNERNVKIASVEVQEPNLENVFLHLTGRSLRD
jgi:ABC-2 type transport system ATP-binding protein